MFFSFGPKKLARGEVADLKNEENCKKKFFGKEFFFRDFENFDCNQDLTEKMQSPRLDGI